MAEMVNKDTVTEVSTHSPHGHSKVPLSAHNAGTYKFGLITPHAVYDVVNNDKFPLRSKTVVRSFNLKAPLLGNIRMHKNYFQIPKMAILPRNWDKIETNPVRGDDVVAADVNCVLQAPQTTFSTFITKSLSLLTGLLFDETDLSTYADSLTFAMKFNIALESIFSAGSLASSLGIHLTRMLKNNYTANLKPDMAFDNIYFDLNKMTEIEGKLSMTYQGTNYQIKPDRYFTPDTIPSAAANVISFSRFMDMIRDDNDWSFDAASFTSTDTDYEDAAKEIINTTKAWYVTGCNDDINLETILAYQLVCAHFYTNDKIDYIYSAELYRQNVYDCMRNYMDNINTTFAASRLDSTFTMNGIIYQYDILSGRNITRMLRHWYNITNITTQFITLCNYVFDFIRLIFGYNRSLRYADYFTGAKANPLAVGNVDIAVNNNSVSAIDVTRNIQRQRFFNFVNRVGRRFEEYISKLNGKYVAPDWHDPKWLGSTTDIIYGTETENTTINPDGGAAKPQNSTISVLRGNSDKFAFKMEFDRSSVVIGLVHFDIERYYIGGIDRNAFHVDRFDMYNPFMQFVGDQDIKKYELDSGNTVGGYFGYALRHIEYKTKVNNAFGGFATNALTGWQFLADQFDNRTQLGAVISPDYIRSRPSELDPFFLSLTSYGLANYFHFIIDNYNICEPVRPMVYAPEIL